MKHDAHWSRRLGHCAGCTGAWSRGCTGAWSRGRRGSRLSSCHRILLCGIVFHQVSSNLLSSCCCRTDEVGTSFLCSYDPTGKIGLIVKPNMTLDYLDKAQTLARTLPPQDQPKLHERQCSCLQEKLKKTLVKIVKSCPRDGSDRARAGYGEVLKELHRVVQKVKTFVDDCCYDKDKFILAPIRVTTHKEKFLQYCVDLDWCLFLVECLRDAKNVNSNHQFEWERQNLKISTECSMLQEQDESDLKNLLRAWIAIPGPHQAICWTLERRLEAGSKSDIDMNLPRDLGMPPITSGEHISSGGFGSVHEIKWENEPFAVKVINVGSAEKIDEVEILKSCCHPKIVNLILAHKKDRWQYLMMERLSMDLECYIENRMGEKIPVLEAVDMISQVCEGMLYLEDYKVSHRDLKPRNILVKVISDIHVKENQVIELQVADFGLAKVREMLGKSSNSENLANRGTTMYRAPEMTDKTKKIIRGSSRKADIYSFGIMCSFILTGRDPFRISDHVSIAATIEAIKSGLRPRVPEDCPQELSSLLEKCWHSEPSERPKSFSEIRAMLRQLKAKLLLTSADKNSDSGTFNGVERPLKILALGDSRLVQTTVNQICDSPVRHNIEVKPYVNLTESRSASPPMCVYGDTEGIFGNNPDAIKRFVNCRNSRWQHKQVETLWLKYFQHPGPREPSTLFPDSASRLHMVWFLCRTSSDLPDDFRWSEITKKLCGLPVQILVMEANQDQIQYKRIVTLGSHLFPNRQNLEQHIVRVDQRDRDWKKRLWKTCSIVKTRAEIENAAMIITLIKKRLGSRGVPIPAGVSVRIPRGESLSMSGIYVLSFLCTYWDIPENHKESIHGILQRMKTIENKPSNISIRPGEFVMFCVQVAAMILYSASNPEYVYSWAPAEILKLEAEMIFRHCEGYDPLVYDQMKFGHIQTFLERILKDRVPYLGVSEDRRNLICSNGILSIMLSIFRTG